MHGVSSSLFEGVVVLIAILFIIGISSFGFSVVIMFTLLFSGLYLLYESYTNYTSRSPDTSTLLVVGVVLLAISGIVWSITDMSEEFIGKQETFQGQGMAMHQTLFQGENTPPLYVPYYSAVCCKQGSTTSIQPNWVNDDIHEIDSWTHSTYDEGDILYFSHTCQGVECTLSFSQADIICPKGTVFEKDPRYHVYVNGAPRCKGEGWLYDIIKDECPDVDCPPGGITVGEGDTIGMSVYCFHDMAWDSIEPPTDLSQLHVTEKTKVFWIDSPLSHGEYDLKGTQGCLNQKLMSFVGDNQPSASEWNNVPDQIKNPYSPMDTLKSYIGSVWHTTASATSTENNINYAPTQWSANTCYLAVDKYVPEYSINVAYWDKDNDGIAETEVYCDWPRKKVLGFVNINTPGGSYRVPNEIIYDGSSNLKFCCNNAQCTDTGYVCDKNKFECVPSSTNPPCISIADCGVTTCEISSQYPLTFTKTEYVCDYSKPTGNYPGTCSDPITSNPLCCDDYCERQDLWCDPNKGCQGNRYPCPQGACCENTNQYIINSCTDLGYPSNYKCCENLDPRGGVGICEESCVVCNFNGKCEPQIGEIKENCKDCQDTICNYNDLCEPRRGETAENCIDCADIICNGCIDWYKSRIAKIFAGESITACTSDTIKCCGPIPFFKLSQDTYCPLALLAIVIVLVVVYMYFKQMSFFSSFARGIYRFKRPSTTYRAALKGVSYAGTGAKSAMDYTKKKIRRPSDEVELNYE